jgi:hypothetical protein
VILTSPRRWGEASEAGFVVRVALLALVAVIVPVAIGELGLEAPLSLLVPLSAALILSVTYIWRPAEALLVFAMVVLFYDSIAYYFNGPIKQLDEISVGLITLIAFARAASRWRQWVWWPRDLAFALVLVMALVSTFVNAVPVGIWIPALLLVGKPVAFLYAAMWTRFRPWEIRGGMLAALGVACVTLGLGLIEVVFPAGFDAVFRLPVFDARSSLPVVKSVFVHPGPFGYFMTFMGLFAFATYLVTRQLRWLLLGLAFSLGTLLSARRRAILSLLAGLGAAFVDSLRQRPSPREVLREWWPVATGVSILLIAFIPVFIGLIDLTVDRFVEVPPGQVPGDQQVIDAGDNPPARGALYIGAVEIGADRFPLGAGLGRYASLMSRIEYSPLYEEYGLSEIRGLGPDNPLYATDTFWPQILGEFGVIGLAAYVAFLASIAYRLWHEAGRPDGGAVRILRLGAGMVLVQAVVESAANAMFHSPPRVYLLFLVIGAVMSIAWRSPASHGSPIVSRQPAPDRRDSG